MVVSDCTPGDVIEIIQDGVPTGRFYTVASPRDLIGEVACYDLRYGKDLIVQVHGDVECQLVSQGT